MFLCSLKFVTTEYKTLLPVSDFKEPLYQFYTAETVRIASQSDSDGYDEVKLKDTK